MDVWHAQVAIAGATGSEAATASGMGLVLSDLGSKNGTWVGGVCVVEALLSPGDSFSLGDTTVRVTPVEGGVTVPLHASEHFYMVTEPMPGVTPARNIVEMAAAPGHNDESLLGVLMRQVHRNTGIGMDAIASKTAKVIAGYEIGGVSRPIPDCGGDFWLADDGEYRESGRSRYGSSFRFDSNNQQTYVDEMEAVAEVLDVLGLASPSKGAPDLGAAVQRVIREVTADEPGDAGDEHTDGHCQLRLPVLRTTRQWLGW